MFSQLSTQIKSYLDDSCSLDDLETWLLVNLTDILKSDDELAKLIANDLDADIVFLKEGLITETEFNFRLNSYIGNIYIQYPEQQSITISSSNNTIQTEIHLSQLLSKEFTGMTLQNVHILS